MASRCRSPTRAPGPAVVLLHGFPDSSHVWRKQVPALVDAGLRAVAPDLRGFGESDQPEGVEAYRAEAQRRRRRRRPRRAGDRAGARRRPRLGRRRRVGAGGVRSRARRAPGRALGPHPATLRERTLEQREKAWYQLLFQFEGVAEELVRRDDWKLFREFLRGDGDVERYVADLSRPARSLPGSTGTGRTRRRGGARGAPPVPPSGADARIWSSGDNYLTEDRMIRSGEHVDRPVALRAYRGREPLAPARRPGPGERAPARFPRPDLQAAPRQPRVRQR